MNFVAHAFVALGARSSPAIVLGAMLPDFFGMARTRGARTDHGELASGIALHHATDSAFHGAKTFLALTAQAVGELEARGVAHGPARAAAHVGIELLLDGFVVEEPGLRNAYAAALAVAPRTALGRHLAFRRPDHGERYDALVERLATWGLPEGFAEPDAVADRLSRALAGRPRLALDDAAERSVRVWLPLAKESLGNVVGRLLSEVREGRARARDVPSG